MAHSSRSLRLAEAPVVAAVGSPLGAVGAVAVDDEAGDNGALRPAAKGYLLVVVTAAVGAAVVALGRGAPLGSDPIVLAALLAGAMALGGLFPLPLSAGTKLYLDTAVLVAAVLLFSPGVALVVAGSGVVVAHALRRQPWDQTLFNAAQATLLAVGGSALLAGLGWRVEGLRLDRPAAVLLAMAVGVGLYLLNGLAVLPMVAIQTGRSPTPGWLRSIVGDGLADGVAHLAQVPLGVLVAGVAATSTWLLVPVLLPLAAYQLLVHHVRLRRRAEARLVHQAFHDPLTDLPNRALFLERFEHAATRSRRRRGPYAVLFIDLDRFKFVNDSFGHPAGDRVLVELGRRLRATVRPGDTVARFGGDEFTVLLEDLPDKQAAERCAVDIIAALGAPFWVGDDEVKLTASVGVAHAGPDRTAATELLQDADVAMYRAKRQGKARWAIFDAETDGGSRSRVAVELSLREAVGRDELRLAFQPLVELVTGRVAAVEGLVRWQHPERGLLPPDEFILLAEETGLILPIGRWVLGEACRHGRAWQERYRSPMLVSVNVSARQFQQPRLVQDVADALARSGLAPSGLKLEITESAMMADADDAALTLGRLKDLGVGLAIDDFGIGYSSLGYLRRFPVDLLKIDKAFVSGLDRDPEDASIVGAVVELAHALGMDVVAEGVETETQVARLRELGCEFGQGYYFGAPLPPASMTALLDRIAHGESLAVLASD